MTDHVHERLLAFVASSSGKGSRLFEMLDSILKSNNLDIPRCVSDSTDGTANISGQYNGLTAWIEQASPNHIHVWCYSHVLNLVVTDARSSNSAFYFSFWSTQHMCSVFLRLLF